MVDTGNHLRSKNAAALAVSMVGLFAILTLTRYMGANHGLFLNFYQHLLDPTAFPADIFLGNTDLHKTSVLWDLVVLLRLDFDNDFIGLAAQAMMNVVAGAAIFAIVERFYRPGSKTLSFLIVLLTVFLDDKILQVLHASTFYAWTGSPAMFGHGLSLVVVALILTRRIALAAIVLTLGVAVAAKVMWFVLGIGILFTLLSVGLTRWKALWFLLPIAYGLFAYLVLKGSGSAVDPAFMTGEWMSLWGDENALQEQPLAALVVFSVALAAFPLVAARTGDPDLRLMLWIVFGTSLCLAAGNFIYMGWLQDVLPVPFVHQLGPIRPLKFLAIFLFLGLVTIIIKSDRLSWTAKAALIVALTVFRFETKALVASAVAVVGGVCIPWLACRLSGRRDLIAVANPMAAMTWAVVGFLFVYAAYQVNVSSRLAQFNDVGYRMIGKWTLSQRFSAAEEAFLTKLRARPDCAMLYLGYQGGRLRLKNQANVLARKSLLVGAHAHFLSNTSLWSEVNERHQRADQVLATLRTGSPVSEDTANWLRRRGACIGVPAELASRFGGARVELETDGVALLRYDDH